jgi:CheY-like chemotaxis protein
MLIRLACRLPPGTHFCGVMRSILIVAPPAPWREALGARLEQEGCAVTVVNDAHEGLAVLVPPLPGAVFIDCDLPRKPTRRLLAKLENGPGTSVRRLFVARKLEVADGPQCGPVFGKPLDPGHVARALRALYPDPEPGPGGPV